MKNKHIKKIIYNFFEGTANLDEIEQLAQWVKDHPSSFKNSAELHYLITMSMKDDSVEQYKKELFSKFNELFGQKRKSTPIWYKYAAIFIGAIAISSFWYFTMNSSKGSVQEEISITLDNGTTKELNENTSNIIANSKNYIAKKVGTKIVYKKTSVDGDDQPLTYNTLNVPYGKKIEVVLSDGTEVYLNSGSSLKYPTAFHKTGSREVELIGEAYFSVQKDSLAPFLVKSKSLRTKVYGTEFNVSSYSDDNQVRVVLVEGSVEVSQENPLNPSVFLKPEQMASYSKSNDNLVVEDVDVSSHIAWKDGILLFKNEDFGHIITKLERHYNVEIEIQDDLLKKEQYTGRFKTETIEEVLQGFQRLKSFEYRIEKDKKIILTKTE